jgi:CRP-like cAMP-binding protein
MGRLFAVLEREDAERTSLMMRRHSYARGETVFHRLDPADSLHVIDSGRFAVRITTPLGDVVTLAILSKGDCFGEIALLAAEPRRTATVIALEPSRTRALLRSDFERLCNESPDIYRELAEDLADQVRRLSSQLVEAMFVPADVRIRHRVAELAGIYGESDSDSPAEIPLSQETIAELSGSSRATVNRVLRACEERGYVKLRRGVVVVIDRRSLVDMRHTLAA